MRHYTTIKEMTSTSCMPTTPVGNNTIYGDQKKKNLKKLTGEERKEKDKKEIDEAIPSDAVKIDGSTGAYPMEYENEEEDQEVEKDNMSKKPQRDNSLYDTSLALLPPDSTPRNRTPLPPAERTRPPMPEKDVMPKNGEQERPKDPNENMPAPLSDFKESIQENSEQYDFSRLLKRNDR